MDVEDKLLEKQVSSSVFFHAPPTKQALHAGDIKMQCPPVVCTMSKIHT